MKDIRISTAAQVHYKFNGFFEAGSPDWIHMSRELMENELIIVTNGTLSIADQTDRYVVNENEYLIMEPGQQFGFAPSLCTFYWLHFDCLFFGFKDEPVIFLPKQGQISSSNRIHNAFLELNNANFVYHDEQTNNMYTLQILLELYNQSHKKTLLSHSYRDYLLQNVKNYVKWNQAYHITVSDIAKHLGYHPKYLSARFHKETGMTLKQYLIQETMEYAKTELTHTNRSILSIALSLGFCDGQAFSCAFKKQAGITPTQFRNSHHPITRNSN